MFRSVSESSNCTFFLYHRRASQAQELQGEGDDMVSDTSSGLPGYSPPNPRRYLG